MPAVSSSKWAGIGRNSSVSRFRSASRSFCDFRRAGAIGRGEPTTVLAWTIRD
jgi:hypothetical protein